MCFQSSVHPTALQHQHKAGKISNLLQQHNSADRSNEEWVKLVYLPDYHSVGLLAASQIICARACPERFKDQVMSDNNHPAIFLNESGSFWFIPEKVIPMNSVKIAAERSPMLIHSG